MGNSPIVLQLGWKIEIWGLCFPCLRKRNSLLCGARRGGVDHPSPITTGGFYIQSPHVETSLATDILCIPFLERDMVHLGKKTSTIYGENVELERIPNYPSGHAKKPQRKKGTLSSEFTDEFPLPGSWRGDGGWTVRGVRRGEEREGWGRRRLPRSEIPWGFQVEEFKDQLNGQKRGTPGSCDALNRALTEHLTHREGPGWEEMALANTQKRSSLKRQFIREGQV